MIEGRNMKKLQQKNLIIQKNDSIGPKSFVKKDQYLNTTTQNVIKEKSIGYIQTANHNLKKQAIQTRLAAGKKVAFLDLGINPYGCDRKIIKYFNSLKDEVFHCYFEDDMKELQETIGNLHQVPDNHIVFSSGLEHMLQMLTSCFLNPDDTVISFDPSFFLFTDYSRLKGAQCVRIPLQETDNFFWTESIFTLYQQALIEQKPKMIFLANPNNPTGHYIALDELEKIIQAAYLHNAIIVIDEAFGEYTDGDKVLESASRFSGVYPNLIVLRTLSKAIGLADIRMGYAIMQSEWVSAISLHRANFPFSRINYKLARYALESGILFPFLAKVRRTLDGNRKFLYENLERIKNVKYIPTRCSIIMIRHLSFTAASLMALLAEYGIWVASIPGKNGAAENYIRVTIGTKEDLKYFIAVLKRL